MSDTLEMKKLRNEVQLLRDELAIMKRKYEDIIYNLDTDNFSSRFVKEQDNMKTAIEVTAEGIKTKVSKEEMESFKESTISQTAEQIKIEVSKVNTATDDKLKSYATTEWTTNAITSTVSETYITDKIGNKYVSDDTFKRYKVDASSEIQAAASGIYVTVMEEVSGEYETKNNAERAYGSLETSISEVEVTAGGISSRVQHLENGKLGNYTVFEQTADGFKLSGDVKQVNGEIYIGDYTTSNEKKHIYFNNQASISTVESSVGQNGIAILCNGFEIHEKPAKIKFISPNGGSFLNGSISLEDYVSQYAGGSGGVATFG